MLLRWAEGLVLPLGYVSTHYSSLFQYCFQLCLEEFNYDIEKVINAMLEEKLPPSLIDIDRTLKRYGMVLNFFEYIITMFHDIQTCSY